MTTPAGSRSFRRQLTITVAVGLVLMVIGISVATTWWIARRLEGGLLHDTRLLSEQFAQQSVVAFLVEDPTVASQTLAAVTAFPSIRYAALLDRNGSARAQRGAVPVWTPAVDQSDYDTGRLVWEDADHWHFVAPVEAKAAASPVQSTPQEKERVGYLHLVVDKAPLRGVVRALVATNFLIALLITGALVVWLVRRIHRLTDPLSALTAVMLRADAAKENVASVRADVRGPEEVQNIARVFNDLMVRLDKHRASLASEVALRTREARAARDAALNAERYRSEFMAVFTHQMRAPLHAITSYVQRTLSELEFVKDPELADKTRGYQRIILSEAVDLLSQLNQILDLAQAEAGKLTVQLTTVDLEALLEDVRETLTPFAERNRNTLALHHRGPTRIRIDREKLQHILLNLATNACKFTHNGHIRIDVTSTKDALRIEVADTGIGIPEGQLEAVFEPFRQGDMSDTRAYPGTGLGLAITRHFCQLLGGRVTAQSRVGVGTRMTVHIPMPIRIAPAPDVAAPQIPIAAVE